MKPLLDNPNAFFKKKKFKLLDTILYFFMLSFIFVVMNELSIRTGFTKYETAVEPLHSILINYASILIGFIITVFVLSLYLTILNKTKFKNNFSTIAGVIAYSITPLMFFGWIPFVVIKLMALIWSSLFIVIGFNIKLGMEYTRAVCVLLALLIITGLIVFISGNRIIL